MEGQKSLSVREVVERVKGADEAWLRGKIRAGQVRVIRFGYNYGILASELAKIARLAANRRGARAEAGREAAEV